MKTEEEIDRAVVFVEHIERHLREDVSFSRHAKVMCKICDKTIDQIYEEERARTFEIKSIGKCSDCGLPATHPSGLCRDCHQAKLETEEERA